jgi:hypothetical protein
LKNSIKHILFFGIGLLLTLPLQKTFAQTSEDRKVIQLSGIVLNADSTDAVPGVNIYVPKKGRGTVSGRFGYFSMPVLEGDTVLFSFVGLIKQTFVIPKTTKEDKISLIVTMQMDEIALQEIEVMPYPTEEEFKKAVLAINYEAPLTIDSRGNLSPETLLRWSERLPASPGENFRNFYQGQILQTQDRYGPRPFTLLNPFAWANFIQSIKRGDLKKKD